MLSPPSDRGWPRLKIWSDANFSYGHSKRISSGGEKFLDFSQKRQSCLGGWRSAPSTKSVTVTYSLDIEDICLHNHMWTKFVGVLFLRGEVFKYLTEIFGKIWSILGAGSRRPPQISKFKPPYAQAKSLPTSLMQKINFYSLGGPRSACPCGRPKKMCSLVQKRCVFWSPLHKFESR